MESKPVNGTDDLPRAVKELQDDVYGVERRHFKGIMDRLETVESAVKLYLKDRQWVRGLVWGLGLNLVATIVLVITLWQALQKLP